MQDENPIQMIEIDLKLPYNLLFDFDFLKTDASGMFQTLAFLKITRRTSL